MTRERGFTLIELMVALVISSLLVGMILAIFLRMSLAYRSQQQVASVQQVLAAARAAFETDAKHAGMYMSDGFTKADTGNNRHSPVRVVNSAIGPDEVAFFYADGSTGQPALPGSTSVLALVANPAAFAAEDLVVLSSPQSDHDYPGRVAGVEARATRFDACVLRVAGTGPGSVSFETAPPWGNGANGHCPVPIASTMLFKLVARRYRIDPARQGQGVLQVSPSGQLDPAADDWLDLAYGFTDIQVATRFFDNDGFDADGDTDAARDWLSSDNQTAATADPANTLTTPPIRISISLVARTDRNVDGVATTATPDLIGANANNNPLGDHPSVDLATTVDPTLVGNRIYRFTTFELDLRNLGAGR